jgi:hypothetical protein
MHIPVKRSQMHSFSTSLSSCQGNSVINPKEIQVLSNSQSHNLGDQVNPMVKEKVPLNGITNSCVATQRTNEWTLLQPMHNPLTNNNHDRPNI